MVEVNYLEESIAALREAVFFSHSLPGPDAGSLWHLGQVKSDLDHVMAARAQKKAQKKNDNRAAIRTLALWLQKRNR